MAKETFGSRLCALLDARNVSQTELAESLTPRVSRAAVSSWCRDEKKPSPARRAQIAERLSVPEAYLEFGSGAGLDEIALDVAGGRERYRSETDWYHQRPPADGQRTLGNPAEFAFNVGIPVLVREAGQNSLDERIPTGQTVDMVFTVMELSGPSLASFLEALRFDQLRRHLQAASSTTQKVARVIRRGLEALNENRSMLLIRIDDYGCHGLTGPEFESGRYMAVVRNTLDSFKAESTAGGSYGLGKAALLACSQFGLVLMNSTLYQEQEGNWRNRFIGRLELPWHKLDDDPEPFSGPAWIGARNEADSVIARRPVAVSYWDNPALLRDLHLERANENPGTSFLIVAAYDPSGAVETADAIYETISREAARNFWPAMVPRASDLPPRLRVTVRRERNGEQITENRVDPTVHEGPKVRALAKFYDANIVDALDAPADVVALTVPLTVEARVAETDPHPRLTQDAALIVAEAEQGDERLNSVSYMRGSLMIVEDYVVRGLPLGARPFHAVVLAGEAVGDTEQDKLADRFLRASEPPEHNKWIGTPEVTQTYDRGARERLREFHVAVDTQIRSAIARPPRDLDEGPRVLKELLRIGGRRETAPAPRVKTARGGPDPDTRAWIVEDATISLPARETPWRLKPVIRFGTDSGSSELIGWREIEAVRGCTYDEEAQVLIVPAGTRTARFKGATDPGTHPVGAKYARVELDVRVEGGGR